MVKIEFKNTGGGGINIKRMAEQNFPWKDSLSRYLVGKGTSNGVIVRPITAAHRLVVYGFEVFYSSPFFVFPIFPKID